MVKLCCKNTTYFAYMQFLSKKIAKKVHFFLAYDNF